MSDAPTCSVEDSGWRPDNSNLDKRFATGGHELAVELTTWEGTKAADSKSSALAEEMGAVLEGRFQLVCGDERYELAAGNGILVPKGEPRDWKLLSERGVLYRVWRREDVAT